MVLPCETEVADFDEVHLANETIACCQISVNELLRLEVLHGAADLRAHAQQRVRLLQQRVLPSTQVSQKRA